MSLVMFEPYSDGAHSFPSICLTPYAQFALAFVVVHAQGVAVFHTHFLAWVALLLPGLVLATPEPCSVAVCQRDVVFYSAPVWYGFFFVDL